MAKIINNQKGFKVIRMTFEEAKTIGFGCAEGLVCDMCNDLVFQPGYYIAVLNYYVCEDCYNDWYSEAHRYSEDIQYEERSFNSCIERLLKEGIEIEE